MLSGRENNNEIYGDLESENRTLFITKMIDYLKKIFKNDKRALILCATLAAITPGCQRNHDNEQILLDPPPTISRIAEDDKPDNGYNKEASPNNESVSDGAIERPDVPGNNNADAEDTPQDDTSETAKTSEYLPIDNVDKSALDGVIRSVNYDRSYLISKINCYREKGFISAMIVDREEADSGLGSDNVGVLIFVNTDEGLKPVNFDIFEYDLKGYFNTIPELSENLTYEEFEALLPGSGDEGKFTPIEEAEINYY